MGGGIGHQSNDKTSDEGTNIVMHFHILPDDPDNLTTPEARTLGPTWLQQLQVTT